MSLKYLETREDTSSMVGQQQVTLQKSWPRLLLEDSRPPSESRRESSESVNNPVMFAFSSKDRPDDFPETLKGPGGREG